MPPRYIVPPDEIDLTVIAADIEDIRKYNPDAVIDSMAELENMQ